MINYWININFFSVHAETIELRDKKRYIASIYNNDGSVENSSATLLLRGDFIILGSYSKKKNIWIWADQSAVLDKKLVKKVNDIRIRILSEKISDEMKQFVDDNYSVFPTMSLRDNINAIKPYIDGDIVITNDQDIVDVIVIDNFMFDSLS